jgi:hypothetical protein
MTGVFCLFAYFFNNKNLRGRSVTFYFREVRSKVRSGAPSLSYYSEREPPPPALSET